MSLQSAIAFRTEVNASPALQARIRALVRPDQPFDVAAIAAKVGFTFSYADAEQAFGGPMGDELSAFELDMVQAAIPQPSKGHGVE